METIDVVLSRGEGDLEWPVEVSRLGANLFRVEEHPDFLDDLIDFGDVFEFTTSDGCLHFVGVVEQCKVKRDVGPRRFVRIVERSRFKRFDFTIGPGMEQHPAMQRIFKRVDELGGRWDLMINLLFLYVPADAGYDPTGEIDFVMTNLRRRKRNPSLDEGGAPDDSTVN